MFNPDDTIVAIATPHGRGGIGVVRISGPDASRIAAEVAPRKSPLRPRLATLARVQGRGGIADQAVLTYFPAPHSYTAEDVVEISAHGSPVLLRAIVEACMQAGARLAEPGEFTFRAFLHGRVDLIQAEAVRDLVEAVTPLQARAAFEDVTKRFPQSDGAPGAYYHLGRLALAAVGCLVVGGVLIAAAIVFLIANAMAGNTQLYKTVDEFYAEQSRLMGQVGQQCVAPLGLVDRGTDMAVEVAIGALGGAERPVDIDAEGGLLLRHARQLHD